MQEKSKRSRMVLGLEDGLVYEARAAIRPHELPCKRYRQAPHPEVLRARLANAAEWTASVGAASGGWRHEATPVRIVSKVCCFMELLGKHVPREEWPLWPAIPPAKAP